MSKPRKLSQGDIAELLRTCQIKDARRRDMQLQRIKLILISSGKLDA